MRLWVGKTKQYELSWAVRSRGVVRAVADWGSIREVTVMVVGADLSSWRQMRASAV